MEAALEFLRTNPGAWSLGLLFAAAALEYLLPPFPADTIVLAGSLLVVAGTWPFAVVGVVVVAGGFLGSLTTYLIGRRLIDAQGNLRGGRLLERIAGPGSFDAFVRAFRRHGMWVIAINRALPGIRAAAFIAAGAAQLPMAKTLFFGLLSNIGWSLGLLGLGVALGANWEKIDQALGVYQWVGLGLLVVGIALYIRHRRRRSVSS